MKTLYALLSLILLTSAVQAQTTYTATPGKSQVQVKGTSTVHEWESEVEDFTASLQATTENGSLTIQAIGFEAEVKSIKSGKRIMDNKTKGALKEKDHPQITFNLTNQKEVSESEVTVAGDLTIAGVTKPVELTATYVITNGTITVTGEYTLLMSDYGIDPPTAMMGTLKTGDEVTISFQLNLTDK